VAGRYGGGICRLTPGDYLLYRDPVQQVIVVYPEHLKGGGVPKSNRAKNGNKRPVEAVLPQVIESALENIDQHKTKFYVFVDTRCLVFIDLDLFEDAACIEQYRTLRKKGKDKSARDLIRSKGGAVRYGFNHYGDELAVAINQQPECVLIWPDLAE
jgi:hypothetical protein